LYYILQARERPDWRTNEKTGRSCTNQTTRVQGEETPAAAPCLQSASSLALDDDVTTTRAGKLHYHLSSLISPRAALATVSDGTKMSRWYEQKMCPKARVHKQVLGLIGRVAHCTVGTTIKDGLDGVLTNECTLEF
jgi:hypothetical protein